MPENDLPWWRNEFFSQFGEDAVLFGYFRSREYSKSRRLDSIGSGFFVDVGAHHPFMISNTWFFYQRGWRGINIEPTPGALSEFQKYRPDDINLDFAISGENGTAKLVSYGRDVKNTLEISDADLSRSPQLIEVKTRTLSSIFDEYLPIGTNIDLLSIDVEGHDLVVLNSNNWEKYRPEILIVEDHAKTIDEVLSGCVFRAMADFDYSLYAWVRPSLIFRKNKN
jgi:FkbM family methyltransferase